MIANDLNKRVEVYAKTATENALGEDDFTYSLLKKIWAGIVPSNGTNQSYQGETERSQVTHKFKIRKNAIALQKDMYFVYAGQRYDIEFWMPNYKYNDAIEVFCKLVVE